MTDQYRDQPLDERGRAAGRDVLAAAARRARPAFDPDRPTDVPLRAAGAEVPRRRAFAVAAALVLVAGVAYWSSGRDGGDTTPAVRMGSPRPLLVTDLPEGFTFLGAGDGSTFERTPQWNGFGPLTVYGPAADEPMLGLVVVSTRFDEVLFEAEAITVDGMEAVVSEAPSGRRTVVTAVGTGAILATSPVLDADVLVRLAHEALIDGSMVDGRIARVPDQALPDGWRQLDIDPAGAITRRVAWQGPPGGDTSFYGSRLDAASVSGGDPGPITVALSTVAGDEARLHAATLWVGDVDEVQVRGRRAFTGRDGIEGFETRLLTWQEASGEIVRMWGNGATIDDLVALAEALEPVEPDIWDDLVERTRKGDFSPSMPDESPDVVVEGTPADDPPG